MLRTGKCAMTGGNLDKQIHQTAFRQERSCVIYAHYEIEFRAHSENLDKQIRQTALRQETSCVIYAHYEIEFRAHSESLGTQIHQKVL